MAYSLRYYYENILADGGVVRLEIHEKNGTKPAMPIGEVVQGLSLQIQGNEEDIISPITTTLLTMVFVDAPDHADADTHKCGDWVEFYTPDSTYWKVILRGKSSDEANFRTLWGGYVTPDSYEEELTYRGSVTIVARDNIGHLADFPFETESDEYGTISLRQLLSRAWENIESPMDFIYDDRDWMQTGGVSALYTRFNIAVFEGKTWYDVLESALYAYGAVLRYVGNNMVRVCPMRYMPNFYGTVTHLRPLFVSGATRMLTPAVKKIEEVVDYEIGAELQPLVTPADFSGTRHELDSENEIYSFSLSNTEGGKGWFNDIPYKALYFDPTPYLIREADAAAIREIKRKMYVVANQDYSYNAKYSRYVYAQNAKIKVVFGTGLMRKRYMDSNGLPAGGYYLVPRNGTITAAYYSISVTQNGITQYLGSDGGWQTTIIVHDITNDAGLTEMEFEVDLSAFTGEIMLGIGICGINATIPYIQIAEFSIGAAEQDAFLKTNRVTTNYNEENNIIISRDPVIAPAFNETILPAIIKNGIFRIEGNTYKPTAEWAWEGDSPQQMALYNHFQTLCYYLKPNNVLEGIIVNGDILNHSCIWNWKGAEHILVGGSYDFLSGMIRGAILRQFARYEDQVYVHVAKDAVFVPQKGIVLDVSIICWNMISWSISGLPDWITTSQMSGTGSAEVQFTIAANNTGEVRVAQIHIERAVLTITQKDRMGDFGVDYSLDYW